MSKRPGWNLSVTLVGTAAAVALTSCATGGSLPNTLPDYMYEHFGRVGQIQTAVILGDLDTAREAGRWLERNSSHPDLPAEGIVQLQRFRWQAGQVARAESVADAARATASLAGACGSCHASVGGGPKLSTESPPPHAEATGLHMNRHLWAADRMWEGLIGPSKEMWDVGAAALGDDPLEIDPADTSHQQWFADQVHDLGDRALQAVDHEDRIMLYGQLLATCSGCHAAAEK